MTSVRALHACSCPCVKLEQVEWLQQGGKAAAKGTGKEPSPTLRRRSLQRDTELIRYPLV